MKKYLFCKPTGTFPKAITRFIFWKHNWYINNVSGENRL